MKTIKELKAKHTTGFMCGYWSCRKDIIKLIDEIKYTWNLDEVVGVKELKARIEGKWKEIGI